VVFSIVIVMDPAIVVALKHKKKYLHIIIITDITGWTRCGGVSRDPLGALNLFISSWDRRRRCR
jgi:hypothetical protein